MSVRTFAVVYDTATQEMKRLIDTSDDKDDSHLELIKKYLAPDETMEVFRQEDFPIKLPRFVEPFIGRGAKVTDIQTPIDTAKIEDISVEAKASTEEQIAIENAPPTLGIPWVPIAEVAK